MHGMTIGLMALLAVSAEAGEMGTITVLVTRSGSDRGTVIIQLANSVADYERDNEAFRFTEAKATGGPVTFTFENVPYGPYAVTVFHDENDNRKIDIGWSGPTERYGFSNGARGFMGRPSFDDAKVTLSASRLPLEINLK